MKKLSITGLLLFSFFPASAQRSAFDYLTVRANSVRTTHHARYEINVDRSFKWLGEFHHQPTYNNKQFNVSLAAFSDGKQLVMIHAETHTDVSGGLDYSNLTPAMLNGLKFTTREQCAGPEDESELNENPQIQFIRKKGFDLSLPFYLKQFLATSADGKAEVVISLGTKVSSCENLTDDFRSQVEKQVREKISVRSSR